MKSKITFILLLVISSTQLKAQMDSLEYFHFEVFYEPSVFFISDDDIINDFDIKSNFTYSIGTRFGKSTWKCLPYFKLSHLSFKKDTIPDTHTSYINKYNEAYRTNFTAGIVTPIKIYNNHYFQLKNGLTLNYINCEETENKVAGYLMSIGYLNKITKNWVAYIDVNYDMCIYDSQNKYNNWSGFLINFGLGFNFGSYTYYNQMQDN